MSTVEGIMKRMDIIKDNVNEEVEKSIEKKSIKEVIISRTNND